MKVFDKLLQIESTKHKQKYKEYERVKVTNLQIINKELLTQKNLQTQFKVLDTKVHP
jgi:hypothetical protein